MRSVRYWGSENWADSLPNMLDRNRPPVDLFSIARHARIRRVGLRLMIPRGILIPIDDGFEAYVRHDTQEDFDITKEEDAGTLTLAQRFSLAHEIAHTRFYNISGSKPCADLSISNTRELEDACNRTAGYILMPTQLLKREIDSYRSEIDVDFVRLITTKFRVSYSVAIERLRMVGRPNDLERGILLVRKLKPDAEIRAVYFGTGLLPILARPQKYTRISQWLPDFPIDALERPGSLLYTLNRGGRKTTFTRTELGSGENFLIQVQSSEV